tara:strand:- start:1749 stop:2165 length:417 start_codon:yes stop_codon:yes gene_type:complete
MDKKFHLDIITPTSIESFDNISYLRVPSLDGLLGIQANHAKAIIGLDIGEIKINKDGQSTVFATSGGFVDVAKEGVQLLLETVELSNHINKDRAQEALQRAEKRVKNQDGDLDLDRASKAIKRAKNRLLIAQAFSNKK